MRTSELEDASATGEENSEATMELYGRWQTEPLRLPCAKNGIVPKVTHSAN